ncbi:MAG: hypothetical protein J6X97_07090 [Lachnospiraceae bacterium]|nr:hypothetical protein [Lachnospiraceae bacterium]
MKSDKKNKIINAFFIIPAVIGFTFYCFELVLLHYNQTLFPVTGKHESDLFAHIEMALDGWGYSILAVIYRLFALLPEFGFHFAIASFLCICEAGTIALTYIIFRNSKIETKAAIVLTAMSGFVAPAYIRAIQPYRYIGYQSGSIWHNSTYIVMKFTALICIVLYLAISAKYKEKLSAGELIAFAILLAITTSVKTNFILVFAPVALLFLIIDRILGVPLKRLLLCALTVIPSVAVILFQEYVLFGEDTGNGIIIDPLYSVYLRAEKPYFTMILSAAFPILILLFNIIPVIRDTFLDFKDKKRGLTHRFFLLSWAMWFVAFVEYILLRETGQRELDDNFAWGYDFCLFILFVVSIIYFAKTIKEIIETMRNKEFAAIDVFKTLFVVLTAALLIYHTYCGVFFFVRLTQGITFFMQ